MISINIYLKFALIALFLGGGILLAIFQGFLYALPLILIGLGLLASYFLLGTVQSAAMLVQETKFEEAEKRLDLTVKPEWLYKTNQAFYYMMKATLASQKRDNTAAEKWLEKAQSIELPTDNEKAMVQLQLANINAQKGKWKAANINYKKLKELTITEPQLKAQIKEFDKVMQQQGQIKAQRRQMAGGKKSQMMRPGGKRRRPKMR